MGELLTFRAFQKLRFFLATVFPFLAHAPRLGDAPPKWLARYPRLLKWWTPVSESAVGRNVRRAANTFALGNYADKPLEWSNIPTESAAILRAVIVLGTLLCLLVPVAIGVAWPALPQQAITGSAGAPVAGWSVWLWMIASALGWSCLLAGTAAASRVAFLPALALFTFFSITTIAALPKTWWNLLLPAQATLAVAFCESRSARVRRSDMLSGLSTAIVGGAMTAFSTIVATPMTAWLRGHLVLAVVATGVPLGVLLWWTAGRMARRAWRLDALVALLFGIHVVLLITLTARGGLVAPAQGIAGFAVQVTGYLWPLYYFFGIGVVFKVLRQTKTVHGAAVDLIPARWFAPVCLALLSAVALIAWSEAVVARPAFPWPHWLGAAAGWVHGASAWLWNRPLAGLTMAPMKWVLLAALVIALWALIRRRFDSAVAAGLLFVVVLLWLGVFEYYFEYTGFSRSYRHTAFGLLLFSAFVLWLTHRTLLDFLTGSSPWWPQAARIAIYGAGLLFVLMPLHARAALHDATLSNEIFLYLFFGVVDLGLPYYLYVYASRRFKALPLSAPAMLGLFAIGALLSVPLIVLDKLAVAGSVGAMWSRATAQAAGLLQGQPLPTAQVFLPASWIVARGALVIGAVLAVAAITRRSLRDVRLGPAATIFSAVAVGSGLASFSNRSLELPLLPIRVGQLITPLSTSLAVDASLIARHLSYLLPALMLGLVVSVPRSRRTWLAGVAVAVVLHVGIGLLWPAREAWLRSTGALALAGTAGVVLFLWLAAAVRDRLDQRLEPNASESEAASGARRLLLTPDLRLACVGILIVLGTAVGYRAYARRLVPHPIVSTSVAPRLPVDWHTTADAAATAPLVLTAASYTGTPPMLWADVRPYDAGAARTLLQSVAMETAQRLPQYTATKLETWDQYYPGALALEFRYSPAPGDTGIVLLGTTALAPMPNGRALVATVVYSTSDAQRRWDLARALLALPRAATSPPHTPPR